MNSFFFFNSLTNQKEKFLPSDPKNVKIYSCGPTVYNYAHIGNLRSFVFVDLLRRSLKANGYTLDQTMNITDIDDKIIDGAIAAKQTIQEFTKPWIEVFFQDLEALRIEKLEHYPKATSHIDDMVSMIETLTQNGFCYTKDGSIYYSIKQKNDYGKLSKVDVSGMKSGVRVDSDEYGKEDVRDFVLWKFPKSEQETSFETKIGKGRPGWHIECSAMIRSIYKSGIDIHTGGVDLLFPHHENEIAQSESSHPDETFVKCWLHSEHLLVNQEKMSKSKNNFYTLRDIIEKGYSWKEIRFLLLSTHYRSKLNFTFERLDEAKRIVEKMENIHAKFLHVSQESISNEQPSQALSQTKAKLQLHQPANSATESFLSSLCDDLDIQNALTSVYETIKFLNSNFEEEKLQASAWMEYFKTINSVLGVLEETKETLDSEIEVLIQKRIDAKKNKDYKLSDEIRNQLVAMGILLEDHKDGTVTWKRK